MAPTKTKATKAKAPAKTPAKAKAPPKPKGGARPGAGRVGLDPAGSSHVSVRVTRAQHRAFHALGGSVWLRDMLDKA